MLVIVSGIVETMMGSPRRRCVPLICWPAQLLLTRWNMLTAQD
jgi:hypothetical protein